MPVNGGGKSPRGGDRSPSHARRIAEELPQLRRLTILPDTGHMTPLERPKEVTAALVELAALTAERVVA